MKMLSLLLTLIACSIAIDVHAKPRQVILIRHAEKPEVGDTLSKAGLERAAALVPFFTQIPFPISTMRPCVAIYAPCSSKNHASTRSIQTVSALANAWAVPFYVKYTVGDTASLVEEIMTRPDYEGRMVLLCWEHKHIPEIAQLFGVINPPEWPSSAFDRVWFLDFSGSSVTFQNLPQQLMFGDSWS